MRLPTAARSARLHRRLPPVYHPATSLRRPVQHRARRATQLLSRPRPLYRLLPPLTAGFFLYAIVDAHEPCEPAHERAENRKQRSRMNPAIEKPPTCAEQQDGDRKVERHAEVLVARAFVFLCGSHVAPGNLDACEIFRKQIVR